MPTMWLIWWIGDACGILLFMPLFHSWWQRPKLWSSDKRLLEWLIVISATMLIGWHTFHDTVAAHQHGAGNLQFLVMPFLLWAAIRMGLRGVTLVSLITCCWVLWGAANQTGPFEMDDKVVMGLFESSFILVITLTGLIVQSLFRELKLNMRRISHAHDELEDRVKQRTADLEEANARLQQEIDAKTMAEQALIVSEHDLKQASDSKTRILAAASHDLRQPLQAIISHTGLLFLKNANPELEDSIEQMDKAGNVMRELLDKLLSISEIDTGRLTTNLSAFPINGLMADLQGQFQSIATEKGLLIKRVPCNIVVHSDLSLLRVILQNMISNAIKYTDHGKVLLGCRRRNDILRICVCDSGIGITQDGQQVIFEEFYQLDNPARDRSRGAGFGLATVQRIADLLRHPLYVKSIPGKGSCFAVDVPISSAHIQPTDGDSDSVPRIDNIESNVVLLIDDDEVVLHANKLMLETQGYRVRAVHDAEAAFESLANTLPDIIISDYRLPGSYTGTALITALRDRAERQIPAIILTGDITLGNEDATLPAACALVKKPVSATELRREINRLID